MRTKHWNEYKIVGRWLEDGGWVLIRSRGYGLSSHCHSLQTTVRFPECLIMIDLRWFPQSAPHVGSQLSPTAEAGSEAEITCQGARATSCS